MNQLNYLRFPTIHNNNIAFVAENDLWKIEIGQTRAQRLTNGPGQVSNPHFSPDGKWIAYSSSDEGTADVYVVPSDGGNSRRLTYYVAACSAIGWTPDSQYVLFKGNIGEPHRSKHSVFKVSLEGGEYRKLSIGHVSSMSFAEDGIHCVIQRGYSDPAVWKRYQGGRRGKIWYGNTDGMEFRRIGNETTTYASPFIYQDRIYYLSDRDGKCNIYSFLLDGTDEKQHTFHEDFYARWPSCHNGKVVYQLAGDIWLLDLAEQTTQRLDIAIQSCGNTLRRRFVAVSKYLQEYCYPKNDQVLLNVRGKIFVMPNWKGAVRRIGKKEHVRYKLARWGVDGQIVAVDDESGEDRLVIFSVATGEKITQFDEMESGYIQQMIVSPDGKIAAVAVKNKLQLVHLETREIVAVDTANHRYFKDFSWSPDSKWLVYSKFDSDFSSIFLYHLETQNITRVTTPEAHDYSPKFDPKGKYLFFLSKRTLNPYADSIQREYSFPSTAKPYLITLRQDSYSPFSVMAALQKDEPEKKESEKAEADSSGSSSEKKPQITPIHIDLEGIQHRIQEVPIKEGIYVGLSVCNSKLLLLKKPLAGKLSEPSIWDDSAQASCKLLAFDLKDSKEETLVERITGFSYNRVDKKMLICVGKKLRIVNAGEVVKAGDEKPGEKSGWLDLNRIRVSIDPVQEWQQIYHEAWRWQRDFFWDENMSGIDWEQMRDKYLPLLAKVRVRNELTDLLWELYGELGTSHAYVLLGDNPTRAVNYQVGALAALWDWDSEHNLYQFTRIYRGDIAHKGQHSPLLDPGINVQEGDYLVAINGEKIDAKDTPYHHLLYMAGQDINITVNSDPKNPESARELTVTALASESPILYRDWVEENRNYIQQKTNDRVGYLHVPDMGVAGLVSFHRDFIWQYQKDGLIIDVRSNGGGHISSILLAKLQRKALGYSKPRYGDARTYPAQTIQGPVVVLCDEHTGSDGDIFCQAFKILRLGTLIGCRTWGGVVGIIADKKLVDGGFVTQPEFAFCFEEESSNIENQGVEPDIVIENDPASEARGEDKQLDKAIEIILERIASLK